MIRSPEDLLPKPLLQELKRLAKLPYPWAIIEVKEFPRFTINCKEKTWVTKTCKSGADYVGLIAATSWIKEGPKIVNITPEQYEALARVEIKLELKDFAMPYPTILVNLPGIKHHACLVHQYNSQILACATHTQDHKDDFTTLIRQQENVFIEESLNRVTDDMQIIKDISTQALRASLNMLLAMASFGCHMDYLYPNQAKKELKTISKRPDLKEAAQERLYQATKLITLNHDVILYKKEIHQKDYNHTERQTSFHWRRGHWKSQPYGPKSSLRKRIFLAPTMIRADLLDMPKEDLTTIYKTKN